MITKIDHDAVGRKIAEHYEAVWETGDAWRLESSDFEQRRFDYQIELLSGRHYGSILEIGCGSGCLTCRLAGIGDRVVALDVAPSAIERARSQCAQANVGNAEFHVANVMELDFDQWDPFDLIVFSETIYSLGWLYSVFDVGLLVAKLHDAMRIGGVLLLANAYGANRDWLLRPWLIDTYRDLARNVGFQPAREAVYRDIKEGVEMSVLMSVFHRVSDKSAVNPENE